MTYTGHGIAFTTHVTQAALLSTSLGGTRLHIQSHRRYRKSLVTGAQEHSILLASCRFVCPAAHLRVHCTSSRVLTLALSCVCSTALCFGRFAMQDVGWRENTYVQIAWTKRPGALPQWQQTSERVCRNTSRMGSSRPTSSSCQLQIASA